MRKLLFALIGLLIFWGCSTTPPPTPQNISTATICDQVWMAKNLDVATYRNGDTIPQVANWNEWRNLNSGAWCYYKNDSTTNSKYGKLYNYYAVNDSRGLAPVGWHIPTYLEIDALLSCLGGTLYAGGKMKSIGTLEDNNGLWKSPNTLATNSSGFNALPSGARYASNTNFDFINKDSSASFWIQNAVIINYPAPMFSLTYQSGGLSQGEEIQRVGLSVRCIKD